MTGYEIMTVFRDSLSHFWTAQKSQIYRELQALEKNGWIETAHIEQDGKPDKNMLSITDEGKKELQQWLREDMRLVFLYFLLIKNLTHDRRKFHYFLKGK